MIKEKEIFSLCAGIALLYWPYVWCWFKKEHPEDYGLLWRCGKRAVYETLTVTAFVLLILTPVALFWPWDSLPHKREFSFALKLIASGLAAAVIEETFFRGWLQTVLRKRFSAFWAVVLVNCFFAPMHLIAAPYIISLATFFPGLIMGALKERYNNVVPGMIFHFLGNVWAVWFFPSPF